ncbi:MAG: IclR family transcriptional regulator [Chloroflexi bacterium]|nr:IclR family transcriptional regulator [Chloroflexota bacterium]
MSENQSTVIQSLSRGLTALELVLEQSATPQSLAKALGVDRSTAYRILNTLLAHGFVLRDPLDDQYVINVRKVFTFAHSITGKLHFPTLATPYLGKLRQKTGEAASLAVLQDTDVVYVNHLPGEEAITVAPMLGVRRPVYVSAVGKAILAHLPEPERNRLLGLVEWKPMTDKTITDVDAFRGALHATRQRGYAIDDEETFEGVRCVAAPVRNHRDEIIAAMGISGPATRLTLNRVHEYGAYIRQLSLDFSVSMGAPDN